MGTKILIFNQVLTFFIYSLDLSLKYFVVFFIYALLRAMISVLCTSYVVRNSWCYNR